MGEVLPAASKHRRPLRLTAALGVVLGLLCCAVAASASAATTYTCSISVTGESTNSITATNGTPIEFAVSVSPGMPAGGSADLITANGHGIAYYDSAPTDNPATFEWIAQAGVYDVRGYVQDSTGNNVCTTINDVTLNIASQTNVASATTITLDPANPAPGTQALATATVTIPQATDFTLDGSVVFYGDNAQFGLPAPITPTSATTGIASMLITVPTSEGSHVISAWYLGSEHFAPSSGAVSLGTNKATPSLTNVGGTPAHYNGTTTLSATLMDGAQPVAGRTITFTSTTGDTCSAVTDASGVASCTPITVDVAAGHYAVTASFAGDSAYQALSSSGDLEVSPAGTTVTYTGPSVVAVNQPTVLGATLRDEFGNALTGELVTLSFGVDSCVATVATDGTASCTVATVHEASGNYIVNVTYPGRTGYYAAASTTGNITVVTGIPTQLTFVPSGLPVLPGLPTLVKFRLADASGPVGNATVAVTYNGVTKMLTTDTNGYVSGLFLAPPIGGPTTATATFTADGTHLGSAGTGLLTVLPAPTLVKVTGPQLIQQGTKPTLSAKLKLWNGTPLAGKVVTLSAGGASCTATTDASGNASCTTTTAVSGPSRDVTITASYSGLSGVLLASTDTATGYVWSFYGSGCFVVGDRDADGKVDFWGSQWWKNNHLSRSSSESSFKGWASSRNGSTWTSKPGNSPPPPSTPLPAYMAIIVSSSMSKSGSTINGDVAKIVIVRTDSGYDANPGHDGTGTVVGTLP